ncbi:hypothetical protein E2C01_029883 [Portunus trituberculatus]|uniref:Uncharacterized protein n=1 Tax=Portunus trituberculatus TaxID=210409 RepID=A0A5B7ESL9_PORTR|nr:hypothetical protein [Portunus trituberculatus]
MGRKVGKSTLTSGPPICSERTSKSRAEACEHQTFEIRAEERGADTSKSKSTLPLPDTSKSKTTLPLPLFFFASSAHTVHSSTRVLFSHSLLALPLVLPLCTCALHSPLALFAPVLYSQGLGDDGEEEKEKEEVEEI